MLADQFIDLYESTRSDYQRGIKDESHNQRRLRRILLFNNLILRFCWIYEKTEKCSQEN